MKRIIIFSLLLIASLGIKAQKENRIILFSEEVKAAYPSVVYDFLERYLTEIRHEPEGIDLDQRLRDDKVLVRSGSLRNISKLSVTTAFSMEKVEDKYYNVIWTDDNDRSLLELAFPLQFELLLGHPKVEMEKLMEGQISSCGPYKHVKKDVELEEMANGILHTNPSSFYYVDALTDMTYYELVEEGVYEPVFDNDVKAYSAANLFLGVLDDSIDGYQLAIEQRLYGYQKSHFNVPLAQWLDYCQKNALKMYFAIEEETDNEMKGLLIAHSAELGFNHMLSITIPKNFIESKDCVFKTVLNAFIPTQNVKELYQKNTKSQKKKKI